jgi:hypothetical protein
MLGARGRVPLPGDGIEFKFTTKAEAGHPRYIALRYIMGRTPSGERVTGARCCYPGDDLRATELTTVTHLQKAEM